MGEMVVWWTIGGIALLLVTCASPYVYRRLSLRRRRSRSFKIKAQVQIHHPNEAEDSDYCPGTVTATCWSESPWEVEFVIRTEDRIFDVYMHRDNLRDAVRTGRWGNDLLHLQLARTLGDPTLSKKQSRALMVFIVMDTPNGMTGFDFAIPYKQLRAMVKFWDRKEPEYSQRLQESIDAGVDDLLSALNSGSDSDIGQ